MQTSIPQMRYEPTIAVLERANTFLVSEGAVAVIRQYNCNKENQSNEALILRFSGF
jgi:hypothetical protein